MMTPLLFSVPQSSIEDNVSIALQEDIGDGDITAQLIPADDIAIASVISREACTLCGMDWFDEVFRQIDSDVLIEWLAEDGDHIEAGQTIISLSGPTRAILTGERAALNFVQTLSATATRAAEYAKAVAGTGTSVLDTRKTIPGLRLAQKYAVTCGGCQNHRIGLYDAVLIKENHIAAHGSIAGVIEEAFFLYPDTLIEIEVENLEQLQQAMDTPVTRVLLDNFNLDELRAAVKLNDGQLQLEASGNITLATIRDIAETGVNFISTGALTKDVKAIDLSLCLA